MSLTFNLSLCLYFHNFVMFLLPPELRITDEPLQTIVLDLKKNDMTRRFDEVEI